MAWSKAFLAGVLGLAGCGAPSFLVTPVQNSNTLEEAEVGPGRGLFPDKIAIVEVEGVIANAKAGGLLTATENPLSLFTQELQKAADDGGVKAVVLRVNSPGGTVSASDAMYQMLKRFKAKTHKPVVASVQEVGASGAYYVSCGADEIMAQPTSLVGSIGVIFETFDLQGTMSKLGIVAGNYKSAAHKDIGSPFKTADAEEARIMQGLVDQYYAKFKGIVTANRPGLMMDRFAAITDGRVYSGDEAAENGLIDRTGLLEDAIERARVLAKSPGAKVVAYKRPYGYGGSIYALNQVPTPRADTLKLQLPDAAMVLPVGFYYVWRP